jgi:formate dehydrogenase
VVTSDKDSEGCKADQELVDADIVISQPFWPYYLTRQRMESAPNLKMAITAGIGSDHVDLQAAMDHKIDVVEVTYCNSRSVAEHIVMMILSMVRDYHNQHRIVNEGGWHIADAVQRSYDVEGMNVGTIAAGRIGYDVLRKMHPFDVHLHYFDKHRLDSAKEQELNLTYHDSVESLVAACDVINISCPLHPETEHLFNDELISKCKPGAYIVNTARGKICDKDAIVRALKSGQLSGYAGDVWFPQPAPNDHVWRTMPHHGMTPHTSGTSLSAQTRYADGVREILECFFDGEEIRNQYLIVQDGDLAGMGAHSYTKGTATDGSEEAANFKK